ncbi:MAG: CoA transferase [Deltaproteobacteria bacterium]|nr:CoA transferase [Deltaproteobacteria bacterium]
MQEQGTKQQDKPGPLEGVKVVEYGVFHAGPGCSAILGDLGADVIKIESGVGDPERYWINVAGMDLSFENGAGAIFEATNRNKKGIYLDIKNAKGREIFNRLVKDADVFLSNLRKSTKTELGIDYAALARINPKIIHANVSGYGPEGPMSDVGAFDSMGQASTGLMFVTGSSEPAGLLLGIVDQATAIAASHAVLAALFARERTGTGQEVHVSLYSTALWLQQLNVMISNTLSIDPCGPISRDEHSPLRNCFRCQDDRWIMGTHHPEEKYWATFCKVMGKSELIDDPRFTNHAGGPDNFSELIPIFDEVFLTKTRDTWMNIFYKHGLMFCSVKTIMEVENDPQAIANNYIVPFDHPVHGRLNIPGYPAHFSECSAGPRSHAPTMGEHTDQVLNAMGFTDEGIFELRKEGVVK